MVSSVRSAWKTASYYRNQGDLHCVIHRNSEDSTWGWQIKRMPKVEGDQVYVALSVEHMNGTAATLEEAMRKVNRLLEVFAEVFGLEEDAT